MPSKEAMAAAEKVVGTREYHHDPKDGLYQTEDFGQEAHIFGHAFAWASYQFDHEDTLRHVWQHETEVKQALAQLLDAHTADLQREVEALRAERDKYKEQVRGFQGAVLELLMVADPDFSTKTFTVPFEEWDYLMSADQNAKDPNQKEIII